MTFPVRLSVTLALVIAAHASAQADPTVTGTSVFATGGPVGGTQPDSVTIGDGSVWIEYGNGADSTGLSGSSTIVRYSYGGAVEHTFSIAGLVDGLKVNPVTGTVWALQNQDGNSTLSFIDPTTNTVSSPPLAYAAMSSVRGYDDVAFLDGKVYLSYTNPVNPADSVLQILTNSNSNNPSGPLTTTSILTAQQTNPLFTSSSQNPPDIDSLKSAPNGDLALTSEGDGLGPEWATSDGRYTLIANPGTPKQTVTNVRVTNSTGVNVNGMDDVLFPGVTQGTLFVTDTPTNKVYELRLTGLDPNAPIISLGSFGEVATVDPATGVVETVLLTGLASPHGLDFIPFAVPEPSTWAMMLIGFAGLGFAGYRRATISAHRSPRARCQ